MTLALIGISGFMIPFQIYGVPFNTIRGIAMEWPFRVVFLGLALSSALFFLRTASSLFSRKAPIDSLAAPVAPLTLALTLPPEKAQALEAGLRQKLRRRGYRIRVHENGFYAVVGGKSLWGALIFHLLFLALASAWWVDSSDTFYGEVVLTEGQSFRGSKDEYERLQQGRGPLPELSFKLENIQAEFWDGNFLFTALDAQIAWPANTLRNVQTLTINDPLFVDGYTVALRGFGFAPEFMVHDAEGRTVFRSFANLSILPSGLWDTLRLGELPYECAVQIFPDHAFTKEGTPFTRTHKMNNPLFHIRIRDLRSKDVKEVFADFVKPGETIAFDNYEMHISGLRSFGHFRLQSSRSFFIVCAAFTLALAGLAFRFGRNTRALSLTRSASGAVTLGTDSRWFPLSHSREWTKHTIRILKRLPR